MLDYWVFILMQSPAKPGPRWGGWDVAGAARLHQKRAGKEPADPSGACVAIIGSGASGTI